MHPFKRAQAKAAEYAAAAGLSEPARTRALAAIEPYRSRGKGRAAQLGVPNYVRPSRSKYEPHQGEKECRRRRERGDFHWQKPADYVRRLEKPHGVLALLKEEK